MLKTGATLTLCESRGRVHYKHCETWGSLRKGALKTPQHLEMNPLKAPQYLGIFEEETLPPGDFGEDERTENIARPEEF